MAKTTSTDDQQAHFDQYLRTLEDYIKVTETMKMMEGQYKTLTTQGVNLEGQMKALREAFPNIKHDEMIEKLKELKSKNVTPVEKSKVEPIEENKEDK